MNLKNNLTRILSVLIVMIIAMTVYAVTALTNVTPEVTLTAVNYQGGEETSGFFEKDQNRAVFKNQYDKNSYYAYKSHNIMPRKITDINEKYKNSLFCLDNTLEFPQGNGIVYQNIGDLRTVKSVNTNQGEKNLTDEQKNKLFWLFENMYLREESKEVKDLYKTELFKNTFIHTGGDANDSEKLELALRKYNVEVTEDDLAVIEQWTIWYIINGDDSFRLNGANMLLDSNKEIVPTTDKKQLRLNVYDYLKTNIDKNGNYKVKGNIPSNYSIFDQKALRYAKNDKNYSILKNIKFNLSNDLNIELKDVKINYLNKDNTLGKEISRSLMQVYLKSDESKELKDSLKDVALKGEFGIKINEVMPENAHGLVITPIYDVKSINANVFIPKEENNKKVNQPIVNIERNKVTVNTPYGIPFKERESQKKYDLALRKSIVSIDGKIPEVSRLPRLDVSTDKNELLQNGKGTTITYKHPKNPLEVNIGSTVKYQIKVYNEETTEGIATEIHDKLPSHLKLKENSELNKQYGWKQLENNVIATNYLNGKVLEGMKIGENHNIVIAQGYVEVELEVTDKATNDEILTNIASIAGQKPNSDRDSNPGNVKYPNDLPGYKGNEENKNDLSDKEYFYKGQEDDDDFEKVIVKVKENPVPEKKYDLALRKSIVSIDGKEPEVSRLPKLDLTTDRNELLQNGKGTTITYKHPKNPLEVNVGSTVKYQIKVYNEEVTEGIVTEIHDKLPSHLKLKENSELNKQYGWKQLENNVIATNYLNGKVLEGMKIGENHNIVIAQGYVEVELEVTDKATNDEILTNIASIAGQKPNSDRDSNPGNVKYPNDLPGYKGNEENKNDLSDKEYFYKGQEDDDDFEKVIVKVKENPVPEKKYDLALRKSIVSIDGKEPEVSRLPKVDTTKLKNDINQAGENTTAEYKHPKNPLKVKVGTIVKYRITVFNEETTEGIATEIHDKLPNHLKLKENSELNKQYGWKQLENNVIATNYLNGQKIAGQKENNILDSKYVEVELEITDKATNGEVLTNIASIAGQNPSKDRDSNPGNVKYPNDLPGYKGNPGNKNDLNDREYFYKGQEDDDDFEKVIVETPEKPKPEPKDFDLSLRKFINEINGKAPEVSREPKVDVTPLINKTATTAIYNHSKEPITVKSGDKVVYTLRVYNEGEVLAKVSEISDYIPAGLDFLPDDEINVKYGWKLEGNKATTKYLENTELKAFDSNSNNASLDYKDVKIALVVNDKKEEKDSLKNIGEIQNHIPKESKDRDSNPGNVKTKEYGTKNQEDDDDYEPLKKQEEVFDFTLKKFITHIESKDGKKKEDHSNRAPVVNVTPLKTGGTTAEYNHSKEPLLVLPEDRVVYTLRVYNEGNIDGYAEKIVDNVPSNLEFIESDPINVKYRWKKTENGLETDYLSRKASAERKEDSKIVAFNSSKDTLAYKDVQVAFRISKNYKPADGIIKNIAEITEDWNEKGIPDRDSKPNNKNPKEDDEDYDQLKPAYFDLSLRKIVSKIFVIENGKTKTVNTNHKYSDSPEGVAKIELDRKKINKTEVKWEYKIRVTNEGVIPGYAKEVTDYIPEGTYFDPKDNTKDWYKKGEKAIATKSLANRLLKPGESAELTVYLRWKKDPKNMGVKTNWAEISEDGNEYGIPDRDSVPGNKRPHEDDIDDAPVALAIATGLAKSYIMYVLVGVTTLAVIVAISKGYMVYKIKNKNAKINKK